MKKTIPHFALLAAVAIFLNGCIVINVEKKEGPNKEDPSKATEEITVESK